MPPGLWGYVWTALGYLLQGFPGGRGWTTVLFKLLVTFIFWKKKNSSSSVSYTPGTLGRESHSFQGQNPVTSCTFLREDAQGDSDPFLLSDKTVPPSPLQDWLQVKWATLAQLHPLFPQCKRSYNTLLIGLTSACHLWLLRAFFVYNLCHNLSRLSIPVCLPFSFPSLQTLGQSTLRTELPTPYEAIKG